MQKTRKAATTGSPPESGRSEKTPTTPEKKQAAEELQQAMELLGPVLDFHHSLEEAPDDDLRIYFDVRMVRGRDTPFAHVSGISSLPRILAYNMVVNAPKRIQQEIVEKILEPLTSVMQAEAERQTFENTVGRNGEPCPQGEADSGLWEETGE